jgi:hypothetical protein
MYHPDVVAARESALLRSSEALARLYPHGLQIYPVAETRDRTRILAALQTPKGLSRSLTPEEDHFIATTRLRVILDYQYFAASFIVIDQEARGLRPLFPLWESQRFTLDVLGGLEKDRLASGYPDGLLLNILKARQLGESTLAESLLAHRLLTRSHVRALCGADVEDQAGYLFRMVGRIYDHLPWFLRPSRFPFVKNREMGFSNGSFLKTAWGKSTRGALQAVSGAEGSKGAIGRGQTYSVVHISELATWENPEQLDTALFPTIPIHPETLVILESTAEFAGDWWHQHWQTAAEGLGRFTNVFIPWGVEPQKYSLPAPPDWTPSPQTLEIAAKAERELHRWLGHAVSLSRDQLYWYETTRAFYTRKGELGAFLKEYPSDDQECFQYAGKAIFTIEQLDQIDAAGSRRRLQDVWAVEPAREIAELRRLAPLPETLHPDPQPSALRRPPPPLAPRLGSITASSIAAEAYPVPPGYGFRRLAATDLAALPSLRASVLAIWEYPRPRGRRRYVLGVDVADGLGQEYSVVSVVREPTIDEPAEEVAQYVSNLVDTKQLAFIVDAIGRFYADEDGIEAMAAIETNSHGLATQDTLQLHLGYSHFYVWEYADARDPDHRYSTKIGWYTSPRSRPILLTSFRDAVITVDPISSQPDFILNSPTTRSELRHFITPDLLANAEHARGQFDDAIFASAIGYYVAWRLAGGEAEPIAEKRRRRAAIRQGEEARIAAGGHAVAAPDWRNTPTTAAEADARLEADDEFADDLTDGGVTALHFDARTRE